MKNEDFMTTHYRISEYLIGIIAGFYMRKIDVKKMKLNKLTKFFGWFLSTFTIVVIVLRVFKPKPPDNAFYDSIVKEAWVCSIVWIIFACHYLKSGGVFRRFLVSRFWQPISKMCMSVYLTHYFCISLSIAADQKENIDVSSQIQRHIRDVLVSIPVAAVFFAVVEAPTVTIMKMLWKNNLEHKDKLQFEVLDF